MPIYCFQCDCGKTAEEQRMMKDSSNPKTCECGKPMRRDIALEHSGKHARCDTYPYFSMAASVSPDQVPDEVAFDKKHGMSVNYNHDGEPEFTSAGMRRKYCELRGIVDRNAGFSDPQRTIET